MIRVTPLRPFTRAGRAAVAEEADRLAAFMSAAPRFPPEEPPPWRRAARPGG
jgi:hypothetical protein